VSESAKLENKVVMVITAHPDDSEFGCAGTIAAWVREGWEAYYLICADGSGGGSDEATDVGSEARRKVAEIRRDEQRAAAEVVGVKEVVFLDYPDGQLEPSLALRRDIVRQLRRFRPARVICQSPERSWLPRLAIPRYHPDHMAAGEAALSAIYPACQNPWDFPELLAEGFGPHKVSEVFIMGAPAVNFGVDISQTLDTKLNALRAHTSQTSASFDNINQWMRTLAAEIGKKYELPAAEEFHRTEN